MVDLSQLNPQQKLAVEATEGQLLILAGAGSGKTKTLMTRVAYIIDKRLASPEEILVVTFTNKAAGEMKERIASLLVKSGIARKESEVSMPWMGTFHSMCMKILRKEALKIGMSSNFSIYDTNDQLGVITFCLEKLGLSKKDIKPRAIQAYISYAKNELITPADYASNAQGYFQQIVAEVYPMYQDQLKENNAFDFDDLIMKTVELFTTDKNTLAKYQQKFKYIMVDEYQDTNHCQYKLMRMLAEGHNNICCVGDDDQSIYAFRGATIRNILSFEQDYPKAKVIKLEQNYRSTKKILEASYQVISKNESRKDKKLWTDNATGPDIILYTAEHEFDEGDWIAKKIQEAYDEGTSLNEMAILYRTNAQSRALEEQMLKNGIYYRIIGGMKFYDRKEIKDLMSYLRSVHNVKDDNSLRRIINIPKRGIGAKAVIELSNTASDRKMSMIELLLEHGEELTNENLAEFARLLKRLKQKSTELNVVDFIHATLEDSKYLDMLQDGSLENESRIENIQELISVAAKFMELPPEEGLAKFLEEVALFEEIDNNSDDNKDKVTLMTIHAAKGLEFKHVFVVGMEEGLFPHSRVFDNPKELEEERRLAYVAITRSKEFLYLTHADSRTYFGKKQNNIMSRFIEDIDQNLLEKRSYFLGEFSTGGWEQIDDPRKTKATSTPKKPSVEIAVGDRVKHDYFGIGKVESLVDGRATISFGPVYGTKELVVEYAPLTKV